MIMKIVLTFYSARRINEKVVRVEAKDVAVTAYSQKHPGRDFTGSIFEPEPTIFEIRSVQTQDIH